jgi:hypothetical protein
MVAILKKVLILLVFAVTVSFSAVSAVDSTFTPGKSYFGRNDYIEYIAGNTPYIISAPHGGSLTPSEIPDRTSGETVTDSNVDLLAADISAAVFAREGKYPHIIICHLKRTKLDANRDLFEAAEPNPYATQAWKEFQSFIDTAAKAITKDFGKGFYIDLHGHGHQIQRLELGYILSSAALALSDNTLDNGYYGNSSSIRTMIPWSRISFSRLLRGPQSLGSFFENRGYPAVPSEMQPNPGLATYFSGGYNTERHGSANGGSINGVQIECNMTGVRDTDESRKKFAEAVAEALEYYTGMHIFQKPVVTSNLVLNEVMFDVPADGDANGDGQRSLRGDEFVEIVNAGTSDANIGGYRILERDAHTIFTFPPNVVLKPKEYTVVFGGVKESGFGPAFPSSLKLFAARPGQADSGFSVSSIKTNLLGAGDNILLLNPQANDIMDEVYWGSAIPHSKRGKKLVQPYTLKGDSIAGAIAQSVTRSPDVSGLWTLHKSLSATGAPYSPGTTTNPVTVVYDQSVIPLQHTLLQNYPNPFNPTTNIELRIANFELVNLRVFDVLGKEVATLVNEVRPAGTYTVRWDASSLPSGVYFCRLQSGSYGETRKLILTK